MSALNPQLAISRLQTASPGAGSLRVQSQASIPIVLGAIPGPQPAAEDSGEDASITETDKQKRLQTRIDWMILPPLTICYFLLFTNRMNVQLIYSSNQRYPLDNNRYAIIQFLFTITYALPEPLWNVLLRRLGPRVWLAPALLLSGFLAVFCAAVKDWQGLAAIRFLIGLPLGALFPGCMYYITCWYPRRKLGRPVAIFYAGGAMGSSLANLLNSALVKINVSGRVGSDWVCIIWGLVTVISAIVVFFFIPDFPDEDDKILRSEAEHTMFKKWYVATDSTRNISEHYRPHAWKQVFTDMKTLLFIFVRMSTVVARDGLTQRQRENASALATKLFTHPSDTTKTLLYVPPAFLAVITTIYIGILSDKTNQRGYYIMVTSWFSITAFIIFVSSESVTLQYVAGFLGSIGTWAGGAISWVWMANNVEGLFKRAIMIGVNVGTGNLIGGFTIPATVTMPKKEGNYKMIGSAYFLGLSFLHFAAIVFTRWYLSNQNREKQHQLQQGIRDQKDPNSVVEEEDRGDKSPDFEYIL
ncbi:hypothetical protein EYR41_009846 [Orbilia oligospora]|uniref:Uncharacterized protein n=1 Tax=Orbilia oligospora TaxID=2813651 RepID=A0A7C8PLN5_ORBOL|nr:hypothetical protein TWF751_005699 [Orbilia oligospora]TGJ65908.1 hypothetical protein EYR41_009846 [Orbilia oligospora]